MVQMGQDMLSFRGQTDCPWTAQATKLRYTNDVFSHLQNGFVRRFYTAMLHEIA